LRFYGLLDGLRSFLIFKTDIEIKDRKYADEHDDGRNARIPSDGVPLYRHEDSIARISDRCRKSLCYHGGMSIVDIVTVVANISLALSLIVAVVFGIAQVKAAARDRKERLTLEALRNFQSREFAELLHYITRSELPKTVKELNALSEGERVRFIQYSMLMENIGMLVAENYIDLELVDKTLGSFVMTTWKKYQPTMLEMREASDQYAGEYFQWLAEHIVARNEKDPRTPYYKAS